MLKKIVNKYKRNKFKSIYIKKKKKKPNAGPMLRDNDPLKFLIYFFFIICLKYKAINCQLKTFIVKNIKNKKKKKKKKT
jgi:hypothetical protein